MSSNKTTVTDIPLYVLVEDCKINLTSAKISLDKSAGTATLQITGSAADLNQINDLVAYLQSISVD
jgi:hypothetical protein